MSSIFNKLFTTTTAVKGNRRIRHNRRILSIISVVSLVFVLFMLYDLRIQNSLDWIEWELHTYRQSPLGGLLIAQYDAGRKVRQNKSYSEMLEVTSRVNRAYARQFHHDFVIGRGLFYKNILLPDNKQSSSTAVYNKVAVLQYAMKHKYRTVLLLDADAMLFDFTRDIDTLYHSSSSIALTAQRVDIEHESATTWNVNDGVTFWNLEHPQTRVILKRWEGRCRRRVVWGSKDSDQRALHAVLKGLKDRAVNATLEEFQYAEGTLVKHFMRPSDATWDEGGYDIHTRLELIKGVARDVCEKYLLECYDD